MVKLSPWWLLILPLAAAAADKEKENVVYRWTDAQGNVHFSQTPPQNQHAQPMVVNAPKPSSTAVQEQQAAATEEEAQSPLEKMTARIEAECQRAKDNLATLKTYDRVRVKDEQGNFTLLVGEEKQQQIDEHERLVEAMCNKKGG
ncbi:DUF4124 domain-containing protein [Gallaecimonas sp. GXIMD4217]|uniref:DUF4124 domain-containing protein n=1 Tax=Gallaecimonas sp. GXIMD4217 TaxID=3131927 RepID=UPI00311ADA05